MKHFVLLGAGFTRNWGGWLASEAFEYLLGSNGLDAPLKALLWKYKDKGGFEAALAELEEDSRRGGPSPQLLALNSAVGTMFEEMDKGLKKLNAHLFNSGELSIGRFLTKFDAIFSLNQDLFLERHYFPLAVTESRGRWTGLGLPGVVEEKELGAGYVPPFTEICKPASDSSQFLIGKGHQPCFKLHGSFNWRDERSHNLVVIGGNKHRSISKSHLLDWYQNQFVTMLREESDARLMVIGYGFGDDHVNSVLKAAVRDTGLKLFIIDLLGVDVINQNRGAQIPAPCDLAKELWPAVLGASRRPLKDVFNSDEIENAKVQRFLN